MKNYEITGKIDIDAEVGILLPTYCESQNIWKLITEIEGLHLRTQILVIDDSSPDKTAEIVSTLQKTYSNILLYVRPAKYGLGTAITDGFKIFLSFKNHPKLVITMDSDYSHKPQDIPSLINSNEGDELVIGSRYCKGGKITGWPFTRRIVSWVANILAKSAASLKLNDCTSGFRCYSTEFLKAAISNLHCSTYEIQIETARQTRLKGFGIKEVPILC